MTNSEKRKLTTKSNTPLFLSIILVLLVLAGAWYYFSPGKERQAIPLESNLPSEQAVEQPTPSTESTIATPAEKPPQLTEKKEAVPPETDCAKIAKEIQNFFSALDKKDYIAERKLSGGSHIYFSRLIDKLISKPPIVTQEKESLFAILNNTAHFYRTLKIEDIFLIKEVLENENESLEELMAMFYKWSELAPECQKNSIQVHLPLPGLYEYAGFFLNTLGGQSYLFRRDSRTRLLIKFYSVKTMDRAEDASLNRYGIDFRPSIDSLIEEMKSAPSLNNKDEYLAELILMQDKYEQKFGKGEAKAL